MAVVHQLRQCSQVVLFGEIFVVDLHEPNVQLVGFVVDVLQLLQGLDAFLALGLVCCDCEPGKWLDLLGFVVVFNDGFFLLGVQKRFG